MEADIRCEAAQLGGEVSGEVTLDGDRRPRSATVSLLRSIKIPRDFTHERRVVARADLELANGDSHRALRFSLPVPFDELRTCSTKTTAVTWHVEAEVKRGLFRTTTCRADVDVGGTPTAAFPNWEGPLEARPDATARIDGAGAAIAVTVTGDGPPLEVGLVTTSWHDETMVHRSRTAAPPGSSVMHLRTVSTMHIDQRWPESERWVPAHWHEPVRLPLDDVPPTITAETGGIETTVVLRDPGSTSPLLTVPVVIV